MANLRSRKFGAHGVDKPARRARGVALTELNVVGLVILAERGTDKVHEVDAFDIFEDIFGEFVGNFYGKYVAKGFFENLKGVYARAKVLRYVPDDAVEAFGYLGHGAGALTSVITLLNELRTDYAAHRVLLSSHNSADATNVVAAPAAFDRASAITLANELKAKYSGHLSNAVAHNSADVTNVITVDDATDMDTLIALANNLKAKYTAHIANATVHDAADSTNTVSAANAAYPTLTSGYRKFKVSAGYRGMVDKGTHGDKVSLKTIPSSRYLTKLTAAATALDTIVYVTSVTSIEEGDYIYFRSSTATEARQVVSKSEDDQSIELSSGLTNGYSVDDEVGVLSFDLEVYRTDRKGLTSLKETWKFLSASSSVTNYAPSIINSLSSGSKHIYMEDLSPTTETDMLYFAPFELNTNKKLDDQAGSNGTAPTAFQWANIFPRLDDEKDIRYLAAPESVSLSVNKAGSNYAKSRGDCVFMVNVQPDQDYDELKVTGQQHQVSSDAYHMVNADWIEVDDPIGLGTDPLKAVPNMGHIIGHAMFRINKSGYQRVPAGPQESIEGVRGVKGTVIKDDQLRTNLGDLGVNLIQFVDGSGFCLRNARMASNDPAYLWFNQIFMRIVYKKTFEESAAILENEETGAPLLRVVNSAITGFMREDWNGVPRTGGKTAFFRFTQDGRDSIFEDVVTIVCDDSNNKLADTLKGEVNAEIYFTPPPPAESIEIGVGIKLDIGLR